MKTWKWLIVALTVSLVNSSGTEAAPGRISSDLSGTGWSLWLDREAEWVNDTLLLPPVDIDKLAENPPGCGWERLWKSDTIEVSVPGTVEEYYWSRNGNPNGLAGDYRGVSWWSRTFEAGANLKGKRLILAFESINLRAEVYVNGRLAGYDFIGNTPFECEIGDFVRYDAENNLDIRITDPGGTFSWNDENLLHWGNTLVPSVHGFGGITGPVRLIAADINRITDIYMQNQPDPRKVKAFITLENASGSEQRGHLTVTIKPKNEPSQTAWTKTVEIAVPPEGAENVFDIYLKNAELWSIGSPNLYIAEAEFESVDRNIADSMRRQFGFRFFEVGKKDGDRRFYLNGRRVFIFAAMTRGFWPKNGMFPTPEYARRDMELARTMGFNMMLYHRAIGQPLSMDMADETGVLSYEEPGGYLCRPAPDAFAQAWRQEKLRRMVIRDRSRPSMVIFNIDDLSADIPNAMDEENIRLVHSLDPSRIVTYNCIISPKIPAVRDDPMKLRMLPFDDRFHYYGWTAPYHLINRGVYLDRYYENPHNYLRHAIDPVAVMGDSLHVMDKDEIIFLGEEGAIGAPVQLGQIKRELARSGADGWRENEHLAWHESYEHFLDESGFRTVFPTVDHLTLALGENMHYFHGRILENTRIGNKCDAYVLNGWASAATRTCIADVYRNPTADLSILGKYTRPLYIAVKVRDKVLPGGSNAAADIYIINETGLSGRHTLSLTLNSPSGAAVFTDSRPVKVKGGEEFGQLLAENVELPTLTENGRYVLNAKLIRNGGISVADGSDDIFIADFSEKPLFAGRTALIDSSGVIQDFLDTACGCTIPDYDPSDWDVDCLVLGAHDFQKTVTLGRNPNTRTYDPITEKVMNGMTLIVLDQADKWAERLERGDYTALDYGGMVSTGNAGRFFAGKDAVFEGLPSRGAMNWEYQILYDGNVRGLKLPFNEVETLVGLANLRNDEILNALCRVRFGNGEIILCTLDILKALASEEPQSAAAKKLFVNLLQHY